MRTLTPRYIASLPTPTPEQRQIDHWDQHTRGLGLRISYKGAKTWVLRYTIKDSGKRKRIVIGDASVVSLAKARELAEEKKATVTLGEDPAAQQQERRAAGTFGELAAEYLKRHAKPNKRSWKEDERIINAELLAKPPAGAGWQDVKVKDITRPMIRKVFEDITDRPAHVMANRVLALISKMLNFALSRDWIEANPAALIEKNDEESRARVLSDDELRALWAVLGETASTDDQGQRFARLNRPLNDAFKMLFYTAQRGGEVCRMRWNQIDLDGGWWEIPASVSKNKQAHRVPLIPAAVELLTTRKAQARDGAEWVFEALQPSKVIDDKPVYGNVASRAKKAASFLVLGDAHLRHQQARARKRSPFLPAVSFGFRLHDIRRSVATRMAEAGVPRADISKVLNHVDRGARATQVYDRYEGDREKRAALTVWARRLDAILTEQPAKVLAFAR